MPPRSSRAPASARSAPPTARAPPRPLDARAAGHRGMSLPSALYRDRLALLTDLYQLTMAYGYWKAGVAAHEACFHLVFRKNPFGGGFTIACGLEHAIDW